MFRVLFVVLFLSLPLFSKEVRLGVIAISGLENAKKEWTPTVDFLKHTLPQHHFTLVPIEPHNIVKLKTLITEEKIDFVITQPAIYVELELELGVSRLLTMIKEEGISQFGSLFITYKHSGLKSLSDIKGKKLSADAPLCC